MVETAYKVAVGGWGMSPDQFWRLHPIEFWWLADAKRKERAVGSMMNTSEMEELHRDLVEAGVMHG